jgi:hypothetical protein
MIDNLYFVFSKLRWHVTHTYKQFSSVDVWILRYLNKYSFRKRKYNNIL